MVSIIVAVAENGVIGDKNALLWHISEDLKYFKSVTSGHPVVMGRKTYESLGRPLPNRTNVVVTRQEMEIPGCRVAHSLEEAVALFLQGKIRFLQIADLVEKALEEVKNKRDFTLEDIFETDKAARKLVRDSIF